MLSILESVRHEWHVSGSLHYHLFSHALYPLHNVSLCCSIYMTVVLAMERYLAVSRPLEVYMRAGGAQGDGGWPKVALYVGPVLAFSILFNLPTFFEFKVEYPEKKEEEFLEAHAGQSIFSPHKTR